METRTGVPRLKILIGLLLAISVILFVFGATAMVLSNAIGLIYPAQATVSLVFSPPRWKNYASAAAAAEAKNKKFTYWLMFSALLIVEQVCGFVLFLFPWYMPFRTVFLMWCSAPIRNNGAGYIFKNVIYKNFEVNKKLITYKFKLLLPKIMVLLLFELCCERDSQRGVSPSSIVPVSKT